MNIDMLTFLGPDDFVLSQRWHYIMSDVPNYAKEIMTSLCFSLDFSNTGARYLFFLYFAVKVAFYIYK